MINSAR